MVLASHRGTFFCTRDVEVRTSLRPDFWRGGKRLLLGSWLKLDRGKRRQLNALFALNRRILKAYLLKESLSQLWNYTYEGAMLRYLQS